MNLETLISVSSCRKSRYEQIWSCLEAASEFDRLVKVGDLALLWPLIKRDREQSGARSHALKCYCNGLSNLLRKIEVHRS